MRVIVLDTNIDPDGNYSTTAVQGYVHDDARQWLKSEIDNASEDYCLVLLHHGYHLWDYQLDRGDGEVLFEYDDAVAIDELIYQATQNNPKIKETFTLFGHVHQPEQLRYTNMRCVSGFLPPAMLESGSTTFGTIRLNPTLNTVTVDF